ncbi:MAG: hypothetical protein KIS92_15630 [Planctomycetota bacterium]|nr:hypothetical protein [Planctomycetota bacterium]
MGLGAIVFLNRNRVRLPEPFASKIIVVDAATGELDIEEGWETEGYDEALIAASARIGNLARVCELRKQIAAVGDTRFPIILTRVLASAFGGEPGIPSREIAALQQEVQALEMCNPYPPVPEFLVILNRLCDAALANGTGIVLC